MSQTLFAGNERLQRLAAMAGIRDAKFAPRTNDSTAQPSVEPAPPQAPPQAPPPTPALPQPVLPSAPPLITPTPAHIDLRGYSHPGAPPDHITFTHLWHIQKLHGKTTTWFNPPPEIQDIIPNVNAHALMTWIKHLGGYDALERNPRLWNRVAFGLRLVKEDQEDERSKRVVEVIQRVERVWLRPFERYCADWPKVPRVEKEQLLYMLSRRMQELDPTVAGLPLDHGAWSDKRFWPPVPPEPIDPLFAPQVGIRLVELSEPGIPKDYPTCFYLMKLWNQSTDPKRPNEVPPLPQPKPDVDGKSEQLNYYNFYMAINELEGGLDALLQTMSAWTRLAFKLRLIDEDQDDAHSKQVTTQLRRYFKDYFCYFGMFCDEWVGMDRKSRDGAILRLIKSFFPEEQESKSETARESSESGTSDLLNSVVPPPQQGNRPPVDLYAYNALGIPKDELTANYFVRLWLLETGGMPPLPAWNGDRIKVDFRHMRTLIDGFGGPAAMRRFPELWREMAYEMKLATREERGTERLKYVVESLQFVELELLLPFERFCTNWAGLSLEEKAKRIGRLAAFLKQAKSDLLLPLLKPGNGSRMVQVDALTAARVMEQKMGGTFYPDEPFEERVKRLRTVTMEEAVKYGIGDWIARYQLNPFSDENARMMAAVLAGAPSTSKPLQIPTVRKVESLPTKPLDNPPAQQVGKPSLWSPEVIQAANQFVQTTLGKIDDSRATSQPRIQVPESERARLKRIIHEAYPFAFRFYCHAALHYMMYAKGPWTEFLMRQACLVLEQFFFLRAGSSVYIADVKDAQFARGVLRTEVRKTELNYTLKAAGFRASHGRFTE